MSSDLLKGFIKFSEMLAQRVLLSFPSLLLGRGYTVDYRKSPRCAFQEPKTLPPILM